MGINIVTANFSNGGRDSITRKLYQYDYGQKINIKGLNLPNTFEVHISNDNNAITAETYIGNKNQIEIPDKFLLSGENIYLWIFLHSTAEDGETRYTIIVPVQKKPKPEEAVLVQLRLIGKAYLRAFSGSGVWHRIIFERKSALWQTKGHRRPNSWRLRVSSWSRPPLWCVSSGFYTGSR